MLASAWTSLSSVPTLGPNEISKSKISFPLLAWNHSIYVILLLVEPDTTLVHSVLVALLHSLHCPHVHVCSYAWLYRYDKFLKMFDCYLCFSVVRCNTWLFVHKLNLLLIEWFWEIIWAYHCLFQNIHQGYPKQTLMRFLKAREWNVSKAHKMVTLSTSFSTVGEVIAEFNY